MVIAIDFGINCGIYKIYNKQNHKFYIGSSKNLRKRRNRHFQELKRGVHKNIILQQAYNKYGYDNFEFIIIENVEQSLLINREQFYIDSLNPQYNINKTANSSLGVKRREETKEKVRQANLGLKHPEWRNNIKSKSQGGNNHWTKKKKFSEESKTKMSDSHKKLYNNGYKNPVEVNFKEIDKNNNIIKQWNSLLQASKYYKVDAMTIYNILIGKTKNSRKLKDKIFIYD